MSEAAEISLKAIGKQDTHFLSKDLENSFFKDSYERHSHFYMKQKVKTVKNDRDETNWPCGRKVKVEYNPRLMGDLLSNMSVPIPPVAARIPP